MPLLRRRPVPAAVRAVPLEPGDRRLDWADTSDGLVVVASEAGLTLPGRPLLEWRLVEKATWQRPRLVVFEVAEVEGTGASYSLELQEGGDLPEVVRAKVMDSVVWSSHVRLGANGGVRVVGRRRRGWEVFDWQLVYDAGTDVADVGVRREAEQALAAARRTVG